MNTRPPGRTVATVSQLDHLQTPRIHARVDGAWVLDDGAYGLRVVSWDHDGRAVPLYLMESE